MKRTIISPTKKSPQQLLRQQQPQQRPTAAMTARAANDTNRSSNQVRKSAKHAVVASLAVDRSRPAQPYTSLALSPRGKYALVASKGTLQLVAVGSEGIKMIRSFKIAHHFFGTTAATPTAAASPPTANLFAAETRAGVANLNLNQQYGNTIVTKVAWSNNFFHAALSARHSSISQRTVDIFMDESTLSVASQTLASESYEQGSKHKGGRHRSKRLGDGEDWTVVDEESMTEDDSLVAAAGSNGVVVVWNAKKLLFSDSGTAQAPPKTRAGGFMTTSSFSTSAAALAMKQRTQQPEGILSQHTRAVHCMEWHPTRSGLLLTASQDGSVKLWERKLVIDPEDFGDDQSKLAEQQQQFSWFSMVGGGSGNGGKGSSTNDDDSRQYSWGCKATYSLGEQDAIRDVSWNTHLPDFFGVVTSNGNLVVYNMNVASKAVVKIAAHTGDASSLDWHPRWPFVVATGGSSDRFVKIWDLESSLGSIANTDTTTNNNRANAPPIPPRREFVPHPRKETPPPQHENSNTHEAAKSDTSSHSVSSNESIHSSVGMSSGSSVGPSMKEAILRGTSSIWAAGGGRHNKSTTSGFSKHVLSVSAAVTQVCWRPPSNDFVSSLGASGSQEDGMVDRHDTMLAVATARQTSAGGSGTLSLWSFHRPFMSLSIVEGHEEGAISDFAWIQTPQFIPKSSYDSFEFQREQIEKSNSRRPQPSLSLQSDSGRPRNKSMDESEYNYLDEPFGESMHVSYIWQNVLSVGRDGHLIMQSFARGERRIRSVPSSCFTMANLSPFQGGYGSLQFFSVYQNVPNRPEDDFMLTGLRQDEHTANAPGVFFEEDLHTLDIAETKKKEEQEGFRNRFPGSVPELCFSVIDQGSLDQNGMPIVNDEDAPYIAPEVLHMSRFARLYKLYPDEECPTRVDLCLYNSKVAEELKCGPLARMWKTVSSLLRASGLEELTAIDPSKPTNAFQFVIFRTVRSLLLERAEAGDVQTNVALCEVLQVVDSSGEQTRIPGLGIKLVREWYLFYIDLLHQMCLFSAAAFLIKYCNDPAIGALSQQSTTIHESCPRCGKPLESSAESSDGASVSNASARHVCKNCRRRVAMCFICHEPVTGMYVWCPGCGHGGHMEHALQWFGGLNGKAVRTVCPTGCGHKCNLVQMATAFPRTMSMAQSDSSAASSMDNLVSMQLLQKGLQPRCIPANTL